MVIVINFFENFENICVKDFICAIFFAWQSGIVTFI